MGEALGARHGDGALAAAPAPVRPISPAMPCSPKLHALFAFHLGDDPAGGRPGGRRAGDEAGRPRFDRRGGRPERPMPPVPRRSRSSTNSEIPGRRSRPRLLASGGRQTRVEAVRILVKADPARRGPPSDSCWMGDHAERQGVFASWPSSADPAADRCFSPWLDRLIAGKVAPEIQLDLIDGRRQEAFEEFADQARAYEASSPKDDPLAPLSRDAGRR